MLVTCAVCSFGNVSAFRYETEWKRVISPLKIIVREEEGTRGTREAERETERGERRGEGERGAHKNMRILIPSP